MKKEENQNSKILRVLIVAPALPLIGGQVVQSQRLIEGFRDEPGLQVDIQPVNPRFFPRLQKIKYVRTLLTETKYIFDLLMTIPRYDIIHIFSASYSSFHLGPTPAVLMARLFGKKTILNYRSGEAEDHLQNWRTAVPIIRLFDRVIAPSGYLVDVFAKFDLKAHAIFNFVNTDNYVFRRRSPLRPVFLSNRNFAPLYNVACILRAFALIQKKHPAAELLVAGAGSEEGNLHRLAAELKLKNVEFLGRVPVKEMPALYERADIYLNSPNIDNMPNSIIEAYAAGTPVVSTNAGGISYILENEKTGLLVDVGDHQALANAALRLLKDDKLAQSLISNASEEVLKYNWENARAEWKRVYGELAYD